jgi:ribonuclease HI
VVNWATKEGLSISPQKTVVVPFTNKRKIEGLGPLTLLGRQLQLLDGVKYLGVFLDSRLNWNQHLQRVIKKTQTTFAVVRHSCGIRWGLRPSMVHWLYTRVITPSILYGALVWWSKAMHITTKILLSRIQRMAGLAITRAMRSTPTAAMEVPLNLTPLDLLIMAEARMALYRLQTTKQPSASEAETGLLSIWKKVSDPILELRTDHIIPVFNHSRTFEVICDRDYWKNVDSVVPEDILIWFTDGSRTFSGTGFGIFGVRPNKSLGFPLGKFATVFQTEICAILECAYGNIRRTYRNKRILIFSDSQAALNGPKVMSDLVAECLSALSGLVGLNEVILAWVPGHCAILGNEEAERLARQASGLPLQGPEPALAIPKCSAREAIRAWTMKQRLSTWRDLTGHRHGKLFISGPRKKRADDLLKLSMHQLKMVVAILNGHAPVRKHLVL